MPVAGSLTISIANISPQINVGTARAEASELEWIIVTGIRRMSSSHGTSVPLLDRNGNNVGTISWTQVNPK